MEYADWMESLKLLPLGKIHNALNRLMSNPPKRELSDGSISEYRGRPTLVDVMRTIEIMDEESAAEFRKQQAQREREEYARLEQRRKEHPEEFFGLADVLKAAKITDAKEVAKPMPNVRAVFPDINPQRNEAELERKKREAFEAAKKFS